VALCAGEPVMHGLRRRDPVPVVRRPAGLCRRPQPFRATRSAEPPGRSRPAFLCSDLGITPEIREDHAGYIASWLTVLKNDTRAIFSAAGHAQKAADFLKGLQPQTEEPAARLAA